MGRGTALARSILCLLNFVVIILLVLGMLVSFKQLYGVVIPLAVIALGSIAVLISFLGCCGALFKGIVLIKSYAVILLNLMILKLILLVILFYNEEQFKKVFGNIFDTAWRRIQAEEGTLEALIASWFSCCERGFSKDFNEEGGCRDQVVDFVTDKGKFAVIGLIVAELILIIFSCCLVNKLRNYKRKQELMAFSYEMSLRRNLAEVKKEQNVKNSTKSCSKKSPKIISKKNHEDLSAESRSNIYF